MPTDTLTIPAARPYGTADLDDLLALNEDDAHALANAAMDSFITLFDALWPAGQVPIGNVQCETALTPDGVTLVVFRHGGTVTFSFAYGRYGPLWRVESQRDGQTLARITDLNGDVVPQVYATLLNAMRDDRIEDRAFGNSKLTRRRLGMTGTRVAAALVAANGGAIVVGACFRPGPIDLGWLIVGVIVVALSTTIEPTAAGGEDRDVDTPVGDHAD